MTVDQIRTLNLSRRAPMVLLLVTLFVVVGATEASAQDIPGIEWTHLSTTAGQLTLPGQSKQQTASLILDVDNDGLNDFVIASRQRPGPSMVWYRRGSSGWDRYVIEPDVLKIEAGGTFHDIDQDGDLDIVMGGDSGSNQVWWWENPAPNFVADGNWVRRTVKSSGTQKHHDQMFGDFDGDGQAELVFWNQKARRLFLAEIPADLDAADEWLVHEIFEWGRGLQLEGLAQADIDQDGLVDIIGGGRWFKFEGGINFTEHIIDDEQRFTRTAAGQLIPGGRPEVVFVMGDGKGRLKWYEWRDNRWLGHDLLGFDVNHGHSLAIVDINGDGNLDIFNAEMRLNGGNNKAKSRFFLGDGSGAFTPIEFSVGIGNHESRIADLDGDGDLDILGKPFNWETPRIDIWLNETNLSAAPGSSVAIEVQPAAPIETLPDSGAYWCRQVVDTKRPWRAIFITSADIDGDGSKDIVTGGWWYKNPGKAGNKWIRNEIGMPLRNYSAVSDFDRDGDVDILGTTGKGSQRSATFVWAQNDGFGQFTIHDQVANADGDFLQGVAVGEFAPDNRIDVALSWHKANRGLQMLTIPIEPSHANWNWAKVAEVSQDEQLSAGDIDRDGDLDLLLGTKWLRNDWPTWTEFTLNANRREPDRNRLVDINNDGRLDAVIGYEAISKSGLLAWYEQPIDNTGTWTEHEIASVIGPMSVDTADMDQDGDIDVVVGEHNMANPNSANLFIYENTDGQGTNWSEHLVYIGDEHHDGAHITDIDGDGDLDIVSIGWSHDEVLIYENSTKPCNQLESEVTASLEKEESSAETVSNDDVALATESIVTANAKISSTTRTVGDLLKSQSPATKSAANDICTSENLQALYTFQEGFGATVHDVSGSVPALDLSIEGDGANWLQRGGLEVRSPVSIISKSSVQRLIDASQATNALSIEAWVIPANITQDGPARIVSISADTNRRNVTLGQGKFGRHPRDVFDVRLRTSDVGTDENGQPSLTTPSGVAKLGLTHLVYTRHNSGNSMLYVDGEEVQQSTIEGDFSNWNNSYQLILANEFKTPRPWLGEFHKIAIYNCALTSEDVDAKYQASINQ